MAKFLQLLMILAFASCARHAVDSEITASSHSHLDGLNWLVGSWTNDDSDSRFMTKNQWDDYGNFLTQTFSLQINGQKDFFGRQIIGWDPKDERVRSWIFDSEGGFGEGSWNRDGDSWYVNVRYTLSDGSKASSTQIYERVDNNSYNFSSTNRDIDGQIQPNVGPCKLTKK
ncbi:MAG: DUF1579 family protein [Verrucomicrobia bacterium]|nr:DUF1579 family protein [Verrucomicrobiota bacterium]MBS0636764.1 DUF1579 family protein [Verrucomicrobiota bacterium]